MKSQPTSSKKVMIGRSGHSVPGAGATRIRSSTCTSTSAMDSLAMLAWVGRPDLLSLSTYYNLTITVLYLLAYVYGPHAG